MQMIAAEQLADTPAIADTPAPLWLALIAPAIVFAGVLYTAIRSDKRELVKLRREQIIRAQSDIFFHAKMLDDIFADLVNEKRSTGDVSEELNTARRELYRATMVIVAVGRFHLVNSASKLSSEYGSACQSVDQGQHPNLDQSNLLQVTKLFTAAVRFELGMRNRITIRERIGIRVQDQLLRRQASVVDMFNSPKPGPTGRQ